jgi:hypothetical protein
MEVAVTTEVATLVRAMQDLGLQVVLPDHRSERMAEAEITVSRVAEGDFDLQVDHDQKHHRAIFRMSERTLTAQVWVNCKRRARRRPSLQGMQFSVGVDKGRVWACCVAKDGVSIDDMLRILRFVACIAREWSDALAPWSFLTDSMFEDLIDLAIGLADYSRRGRRTPHPISQAGEPPNEARALPPVREES